MSERFLAAVQVCATDLTMSDASWTAVRHDRNRSAVIATTSVLYSPSTPAATDVAAAPFAGKKFAGTAPTATWALADVPPVTGSRSWRPPV